MALNAKLKKAVSMGLITPAQAELLASQTNAKKTSKTNANLPGFFSRVGQIIGGLLAISGLGIFTYWANINLASWIYTLLMLGYVCISLTAFLRYNEKSCHLSTAIFGVFFSWVACNLTLSLLATFGLYNNNLNNPEWHISHSLSLVLFLAATYTASKCNHWLININFSLSIALFTVIIIAHLNEQSSYTEQSNAFYLLITGLLITLFTYLWRKKIQSSTPKSTTAIHVVSAFYLYMGIAALEPGLNFIPQSLPFLTLYLLLIVFGAFIQRRAYIFAGGIGILGFVADYLWAWLANPLLFSFIAIGLGLFMVYGTSQLHMALPTRWVKKLPLPAAIAKN